MPTQLLACGPGPSLSLHPLDAWLERLALQAGQEITRVDGTANKF